MEKPENKNKLYYNKKLKPLAKALRRNMTKAEASLWKYILRAGKMKGYHFNRQRPVLNFIADFMCKELKLIIEVDGITHLDEEIKRKDKLKDNELKKNGFHVLRFRDEEVLNNISWVAFEIENKIKEIETSPFTSPSRGGQVID